MVLEPGEWVPADCRVLEADHLEVDESALTGESLPVSKTADADDAEAVADQTGMLFAGTAVVAGRAVAVVVATGDDTVAGRAAAGAGAPPTGVEHRLQRLAAHATPVALGAGAVTMAANLARGRPVAETLATGVSLAVAAVPEGLPILATAAQLGAGKRLAARGVLVRNMRAVEALGRVDVLCLDKTGTLTDGVLRLAAVHDGTRGVEVSGAVDPGSLAAAHRRVLETALAVSAATPAERRRPAAAGPARRRRAGRRGGAAGPRRVRRPGRSPAADARPALDKLSRAGVRPIVATGDPATARRLADNLGILTGTVVTGPELDRLTDDELDDLLPELAVCARVTPEHKARLVAAFQRTGHAVAMTGDGVNDAAAIRRADVGIALGGESAEAARRAADVVLVRDHVGSIVEAVIEGRSLWVAVRDAVANLLGHNYGEIAVIAGASLLTGTTPLTARQLLLVNLLTDTVPALSIAMRPPPDLDPARLLAEGPDRSFGPALKEVIAVRGIAMGLTGPAATSPGGSRARSSGPARSRCCRWSGPSSGRPRSPGPATPWWSAAPWPRRRCCWGSSRRRG